MSVETPATNRQLTFGEQLCGVSFNPSKMPEVDEVKKQMAAMADLVNEWAQKNPVSEVVRQHCFGEILNAQMSIVKLITLS